MESCMREEKMAARMRLTNRRTVVRMEGAFASMLADAIGRSVDGFGKRLADVRNSVMRSLRGYAMAGTSKLADVLLYSRFADGDYMLAREAWSELYRMGRIVC